MAALPSLQMRKSVNMLMGVEDGYRRFGCGWELYHRPDGSWELYHYGSLLYVIDRGLRSQVYLPAGEEDMGLSKSDRDSINSLSLLVLGRMEIPPLSTMSKKEREEAGL